MRFPLPVKEKIARILGEYFTTSQIVNVFTEVNVPTDRALYAKWSIALDAFNKLSEPDMGIPAVLEAFTHPLHFEQKPQERKAFIKKLNGALEYVDIEMRPYGRSHKAIDILSMEPVLQQGEVRHPSSIPFPITFDKTSTDYIAEALKFFKDEYNKVRFSGLTYEYSLGENFNSNNVENGRDDYDERLNAIKRLEDAGFITEFEVITKVECEGMYEWDYAACKIDDGKLTEQKQAPKATNENVEALTQKIMHEHTHRFENSIQEKGIDLNHKFDEKKSSGFYITKKDDDFLYKGRFINLSKKSDYYAAFSALYALLPEGGEVSYKDLIEAVKSHFPKMRFEGKSDDEMRKFLQRNLTDKNNGFMRYANIPENEDNGKPLIRVVRSTGIAFNNKSG